MIYVYIDLNAQTHLVGQLWTDLSSGTEQSTFKYHDTWLNNKHAFALEPALPLTNALHHTKPGQRIFSGLADSAHDTWARKLIHNNAGGKKLYQFEYLLGIHDFSRFGALRFAKQADGPFLASDGEDYIPPLFSMANFLNASAAQLRLLIDPPAELATFRPKASIVDQRGNLLLAKFSQQSDEHHVMCWEAVALHLATQAGITVPNSTIQQVHNNNVLLVDRFDRHGLQRIHYISGIGMLNSSDDAKHSYLDLCSAIKQYCSNPQRDLRALWQRLVFNILVSNFDDHLRNHGFLYINGWQLAPLFDVIPSVNNPLRHLATSIDGTHDHASIDTALAAAQQFELDLRSAKSIVKEVANATAQWRSVATQFNIPAAEIDIFAQAFEHKELELAKKL